MKTDQKEFETLIVDADKMLLTAAQSVEESYVEATYKPTGEVIELKNITTLWGTKRSGVAGEAGRWATWFGLSPTREHIEVENKVRLRTDIKDHLNEAKLNFDRQVSYMKNNGYTKDYKLCIHGEGNFRYDVAKILPYKGGRSEKPLVFQELKELVFAQYKNKIIISNGYESDDKLGILATESQAEYRKTGVWKYLLAYCDKDLNQLSGPHINFDKMGEGVQWINPTEACYNFCKQMIMGDATDKIQGLPSLTEAMQERLGLRKAVGCGDVSAKAILGGSSTPKEMLEAVIEAYKEVYEEPVTFVSDSDGEEYTYTWKEFLLENARLLWMLRSEEVEWDIFTDLFDKVGITY